VPDDLEADAFRGFKGRQPARPVVFAGRFLDQMPAQAVADRAETQLLALAVIAERMLVVAGRPNEVEANAIAPSVRRTFEAGLEERGEGAAHGSHQCTTLEMEPL